MRCSHTVLAAAVALCVGSAANAQMIGDPIDRSAYPVIDEYDWFIPVPDFGDPDSPPAGGEGLVPRGGPPTAFYSSGISPFSPISYYQTVGGRDGIVDDFAGNRVGETDLHLTSFTFIGGAVGPAAGGRGGHRIFFDFFNSSGILIDGFAWNAPTYQIGGWSIPVQPAQNVMVDNAGFVQVSGGTGTPSDPLPTTLRWYYTGDTQIGDNEGGLPADSTFPHTIYAFQVTGGPNIPAPGSLALLGLGAIIAALRKR
jgi:hypothetical protein